LFASQNITNLKLLKSAAIALNRAAQGLGTYSTEQDLVSAAQNFATAYNKTVSLLTSGTADGEGVTQALELVADNRMTSFSMNRYGSYTANRMATLGISIDQEGMMQVDSQKLSDAAAQSPATVKSMLSGYGSLSEVTETNASEAMRIPISTYTDFSNMQVSNSLIDMLLPQKGFLFDFSL
jgi:flagellar capping protein FliD